MRIFSPLYQGAKKTFHQVSTVTKQNAAVACLALMARPRRREVTANTRPAKARPSRPDQQAEPEGGDECALPKLPPGPHHEAEAVQETQHEHDRGRHGA